MCHCIMQYYAHCDHIDLSLTTIIHCEHSMNENYDCHLEMKKWFIPRSGVCNDCKYQQKLQKQRKCRRSRHKIAVSPPPAKTIAGVNGHGNAGRDGKQSYGRDFHGDEESNNELENQGSVDLCSTPPSASSGSSSRKMPLPGQPASKRRPSSIPVPRNLTTETRVRRSLIPRLTEKSTRQSIVAGEGQEILDDLQVFDRVTF